MVAIPFLMHAAAVISFAFVGFEAVSTAAHEAKNPQRDMPVGILASLAICTVLYILVGAVLTGLVPYKDLNVPDPLAVAVDALHIGWLKWIVKSGAIIGMFSVTLVLLYGQTRIFFSMARDGLLPALFAAVHPRLKTPHWNTEMPGLSRRQGRRSAERPAHRRTGDAGRRQAGRQNRGQLLALRDDAVRLCAPRHALCRVEVAQQ
jgi:hypothetical protein